MIDLSPISSRVVGPFPLVMGIQGVYSIVDERDNKLKHYTQGKVECLDAIDSVLEESSRKTSTVPRLSNICGGSAIKAVH